MILESGAANSGRSRLSGGSSVTLEKLLAETQQTIETAANDWNATDLTAVGHSLSSLESSAAELKELVEIMQGSPAVPADSFRTGLLNLKRSAARMERLVDASSAFVRAAGLYQAGESASEAALPEVRGIEV